MKFRWVAILAALAVGSGLVVGLISTPDSSRSTIDAPPRRSGPLGVPFLDELPKLRALSGDLIDLRPPVGGATVVVFDATDCPTAEGALSAVARLRKDFPPHAITVAGIRVGSANRWEPDLEIPLAGDPSGSLARRFGVTHLPEALVLVDSGRLAYRGPLAGSSGTLDPAASRELREAIAAVLDGRRPRPSRREPSGCPVKEETPSPETVPTFAGQVEPILRRNCQPCHRPGESAPFPLLTYNQAAKRAADLADVAEIRLMPPWKPTPGIGPPLRHDRSLLPFEIQTLRAWADAGAPEGQATEIAPTSQPESAGEWTLGTPDLILEMPEEFAVPATGPDIYRCFVLPTGLTEDRAITAVEILPGNPRVVHHTFNYIDIRGIGRDRDEADPEPGYMCFSGFTGDQIFGAMGGWTPGNEPHFFEPGVGLNLPKGADVVMQVHYHPSGKAERDRTRVGLHFAREPIRQSLQWVSACADPNTFAIPANADDHRIEASLTLPMAVELHAMTPHMHFLGRRLSASYTLPDGRTEPLIEIDDWDFNRQDTYYLREPLPLPAGTVVSIVGIFDNTDANPRNPNHPPRLVEWGEGSNDDMLILFLALTDPSQDLTQPGSRDDFMEDFFRKAGIAPD